MLSRLETESAVTSELGPSMNVKGEIIRYKIFDDVTEYMNVLWDQGAISVELQHLEGKQIYLHTVWDNSRQSTEATEPIN